MLFKKIRTIAVKAIALLSVTAVCAGFTCAYMQPVDVSADEDEDELYTNLYDVFKDRSGDPENFMTEDQFVDDVLYYCNKLKGIAYTYGTQEHYLACDGYVSLVFRMTFGTVYEYERYRDKYWCKFDYHEEHIVADSNVDKYEVYRPGGTSVTWLYKHYFNEIVDPIVSRKYVEGWDNDDWVEYIEEMGIQPGDLMFWDSDKDRTYWAHIGFYAGMEDGVPMMWHASSVQGKVVKQSLEDVTYNIQVLDYVGILPLTDHPLNVGFYVDNTGNDREFSYSVYKDADCSEYLGRISSCCTLSEQASLDNIAVYPNWDKSAYERTLYLKRDVTPYSGDSNDVYKIVIRIEPCYASRGTLKYSIYGAADMKYYGGQTVNNYDYKAGGSVISISDFR